MSVIKNRSTLRDQQFWDHVEKVAEEVKTWPAWMKGSPVNRREVTPPKPVEEPQGRGEPIIVNGDYVYGTGPSPIDTTGQRDEDVRNLYVAAKRILNTFKRGNNPTESHLSRLERSLMAMEVRHGLKD